MTEQDNENTNVIDDQTGELDIRFTLWRTFCAKYDVAVETLPSELEEELKKKWEEIKERNLK
jgi:hypothetical protein